MQPILFRTLQRANTVPKPDHRAHGPRVHGTSLSSSLFVPRFWSLHPRLRLHPSPKTQRGGEKVLEFRCLLRKQWDSGRSSTGVRILRVFFSSFPLFFYGFLQQFLVIRVRSPTSLSLYWAIEDSRSFKWI